MTSTHDEVSTSIILKTDRIGRTHYSEQYKSDALEAYDRSSLSGPVFAKQCGIKYPTFASWVSKRQKASASPVSSGQPNAFILAELSEDFSNGDALEIQLPGGATVRVSSTHHVNLLAQLLKTLA